MGLPERIKRYTGRSALVDGIPFELPVGCKGSPVLMAVFPINAEKAAKLLPGDELHPLRLWNKGLLVITVIDYRDTSIGTYIEYSIGIACTKGRRPAPRLLPALFMKRYATGQYVVDLPVSSEISVKGGRGIWGMPKRRASLNFKIGDDTISSQYDDDGKLVAYVEVNRPKSTNFSINLGAANYSAFRGMLMKSYLYFKAKMGFSLFGKARGRFEIGDHPRLAPLKDLEIAPKPMMTAFIPSATGTLDDHFECWFLTYDNLPPETPEGMETVSSLGLGEDWLAPPSAPIPPAES